MLHKIPREIRGSLNGYADTATLLALSKASKEDRSAVCTARIKRMLDNQKAFPRAWQSNAGTANWLMTELGRLERNEDYESILYRIQAISNEEYKMAALRSFARVPNVYGGRTNALALLELAKSDFELLKTVLAHAAPCDAKVDAEFWKKALEHIEKSAKTHVYRHTILMQAALPKLCKGLKHLDRTTILSSFMDMTISTNPKHAQYRYKTLERIAYHTLATGLHGNSEPIIQNFFKIISTSKDPKLQLEAALAIIYGLNARIHLYGEAPSTQEHTYWKKLETLLLSSGTEYSYPALEKFLMRCPCPSTEEGYALTQNILKEAPKLMQQKLLAAFAKRARNLYDYFENDADTVSLMKKLSAIHPTLSSTLGTGRRCDIRGIDLLTWASLQSTSQADFKGLCSLIDMKSTYGTKGLRALTEHLKQTPEGPLPEKIAQFKEAILQCEQKLPDGSLSSSDKSELLKMLGTLGTEVALQGITACLMDEKIDLNDEQRFSHIEFLKSIIYQDVFPSFSQKHLQDITDRLLSNDASITAFKRLLRISPSITTSEGFEFANNLLSKVSEAIAEQLQAILTEGIIAHYNHYKTRGSKQQLLIEILQATKLLPRLTATLLTQKTKKTEGVDFVLWASFTSSDPESEIETLLGLIDTPKGCYKMLFLEAQEKGIPCMDTTCIQILKGEVLEKKKELLRYDPFSATSLCCQSLRTALLKYIIKSDTQKTLTRLSEIPRHHFA